MNDLYGSLQHSSQHHCQCLLTVKAISSAIFSSCTKSLETDEHIGPIPDSTNQDTISPFYGKCKLQHRIKEACKGHLQWSFGKDVLLASQSWPLSKAKDGIDQSNDKASTQPFVGSLQILKLFEFARIFTRGRVDCESVPKEWG